MKLVTSKDMNAMDKKMMNDISSTQLMKQAAQSVYECVCDQVPFGKKILVICGSGNNGGDGYAFAYLAKSQYNIHIISLYEPQTADAKYYRKRIENEVPILSQCNIESYDVVIDAIFGTGLHREINDDTKQLIQEVNNVNVYTISIDIPSGIHADSGEVLGVAVQADLVVTFQYAKRGMYFYPGYTYCKEIVVKDIGILKQYQNIEQPIELLTKENVGTFIPKRYAHSHKGTYGKVLMIGGSASMHGAITLAADSALHSGIGTLTLFIPKDIREIISNKLIEAMLINAPSEHGFFSKDAIPLLREHIENYDVVMIGCGLGRNEVSMALLEVVLKSNKPCVVDADALYMLGQNPALLKREASVILTPHLKEFSYISQFTMDEIQQDRFACVQAFLSEFKNVTLVLKDERTLIFHQNQIYLNIRGCDALAKGGSGDVLCGLITSFFAQGKIAAYAACSGVYMHAVSSEYVSQRHTTYSVLPHELRDSFDAVFQDLLEIKND